MHISYVEYKGKLEPAGRINSIETCGTVDGPGLRYVIFVQGCPLKCLYCHNPDSASLKSGKLMSIPELIEDIEKYTPFIKGKNGGVTISGGEPLLQYRFLKELLAKLKEKGIHTAIDTSGYTNLHTAEEVIKDTDLFLLDLKSHDPKIFKNVTGKEKEYSYKFAEYLDSNNKKMWIRFVLVPGVTDQEHNIRGIADFVAKLKNVERVEILGFHKMGEFKYDKLGMEYKLADVPPATEADVNRAKNLFKEYLPESMVH